jgi:tetratricopeptide (TPR) repeat protein
VPADRFSTATQFAIALEQVEDTEASPAATAPRRHLSLKRGLAIGMPLIVAGFGGWWLMAESRGDAAELKSIAVLPCESLSRDTAQAFVGDRWTEELIDKFSQVGELRTKSWLAMRRYRATPKDTREIAVEVGAGTLVRCRISETSDSLRLSVQAIEASSDRVLWSRTYAQPISAISINAVQTQVATDLASALDATPSPSERVRLDRPLTQDTEALQAYRLGRHFLGLPDREKSIAHFKRAITKDSLLAAAYVGLADATFLTTTPIGREAVAGAAQLVLKALAINPTLAEAHTLLATYLFWYNYDWPTAEQEYRRALELNPNSSIAHLWYGLDLNIVGHYDRGIRELERAVQLDPAFLLARSMLIMCLRRAGRYDRAHDEVRTALEVDPENRNVLQHLGLLLLQEGRTDSAVAVLEKAEQLGATGPDARARLGHAYGVAGHRRAASQILGELLRGLATPIDIARVHMGLGSKDEAMKWLQRAYDERTWALVGVLGGVDYGFEDLQGDPGFQDLRRRVGFERW